MLVIAYHFNIPEHGADRMGREGTLYELAQWYPRMAVYDDQLGWNTDQYLVRANSIWSTAITAMKSRCRPVSSLPAPAYSRIPSKC